MFDDNVINLSFRRGATSIASKHNKDSAFYYGFITLYSIGIALNYFCNTGKGIFYAIDKASNDNFLYFYEWLE